MAINLTGGTHTMVLNLAVILLLGNICNGNQCFKPDTDIPLTQNFKIDTDAFLTGSALGPVDCVRICKLHSLCNYMNFNKQKLECSLLAINGPLISDKDYFHIDVEMWNDNILLDGCKHHQCPNNTMCMTESVGYACQPIGCNAIHVDNINYTSFSSKPLWNFGETVEYACTGGYFTRTNATCLTTGKWSSFTCERYIKCGDHKVCSVIENKHYWIYLRETKKLHKLHCKVGVGASLTLIEYNMASTPTFLRNASSCTSVYDTSNGQGYTDFQKVRIKMFPVEIVTNLYPFTNSTNTQQKYGHAGDCYAGTESNECGVLGKFIINTRGTGLRIKPWINWKTVGTSGVIENITRSQDGNVIEGYCGGMCGGCAPDGNLYLEADPNYTPPFESAELPICRYPHETV